MAWFQRKHQKYFLRYKSRPKKCLDFNVSGKLSWRLEQAQAYHLPKKLVSVKNYFVLVNLNIYSYTMDLGIMNLLILLNIYYITAKKHSFLTHKNKPLNLTPWFWHPALLYIDNYIKQNTIFTYVKFIQIFTVNIICILLIY